MISDVLPGLDMFFLKDPAQHYITAGADVDDLDFDLDLSVRRAKRWLTYQHARFLREVELVLE